MPMTAQKNLFESVLLSVPTFEKLTFVYVDLVKLTADQMVPLLYFLFINSVDNKERSASLL